MNKKIKLNNKEINYKLKKSKRAKRLRITVNCDASVTVTLPSAASEIFAENFLKEKFDWVFKKVEYFKKNSGALDKKRYSRQDYLKNKEKARKFIESRVGQLNKFYNFKFNRISVRNQKTRWGSCSKNRNLNFNYKLIYLPDQLSDYIITHELCHLKEFNHSGKFWSLVGESIPNHRGIRKKLKNIKV